VTLPAGLTSELDPLTSPIGEIFKFTLESDSKGLRELSELQRWTVIPELSRFPELPMSRTSAGSRLNSSSSSIRNN